MTYIATMRTRVFACLILLFAALPALADVRPENKVAVSLLSAASAIVPGQPFLVAVRQSIAPGWHTYWQNPGDSGQAMELSWQLPEGFTAGEILWPVPERIPVGPLMNYGYADEALFLVEITPPATLFDDSVTLRAAAFWLACAEICIPEEGEVGLSLPVAGAGGFAAPSADATVVKAAQQALPRASPWPATLSVTAQQAVLRVAASGLQLGDGADIHFLPHEWGLIDHAAAQPLAVDAGSLSLTLTRGDLKTQPLESLSGLLVIEERLDGRLLRQAFVVEAAADDPMGAMAAAAPGASASPSAPDDVSLAGIGFWQALLFAVFGGLILNLMPCVFPVLSLKALALARGEASGHRRQALAYAAGVLASFALLAGILVALRATGLAVGWGFQFQSPVFVLAMALVFLALALSLSGVFVIGGGAVGIGSGLAARDGTTGSFFTGVLATVVATPCTAPFMGAALGYALTQPAVETVAVLMALGLGLALPLTLVGFLPGLARLLPKPGRWMDTFKQAMAFPLYASAGWLVWVLSLQAGSEGVLAAMAGLTLTGLAAWLFGRGQASGGWLGRAAAAATLLAALALSYGMLADAPQGEQPGSATVANENGNDVEAYRPARLSALQAEGRVVFINLTAAWCITCKVNEQVALKSPLVAEAMARKGVVYMKGDWTNQDADISALLQRYGRAGVPLYLLIEPADAAGGGQVLPQILTEAILLDAFEALPDPAPRRKAGTTASIDPTSDPEGT
mgnify:CR=1 FL=1